MPSYRDLILLAAVAWLASCVEVGQPRPKLAAPPCIATSHGCIALNPDVTEESLGETICVAGYTATIRPATSYTNGVKRQLLREAGLDASRMSDYELDHIVPLAVGGHPRKLSNLALQPWRGENSAMQKDELERRLQRMVCSGRIRLAAAQYCIAEDWHACRSDIAAGRAIAVGKVPAPGPAGNAPDRRH